MIGRWGNDVDPYLALTYLCFMQGVWKSTTMVLAGLGFAMDSLPAKEVKWNEVIEQLHEINPPSPDWASVLNAKIAAGLPLPEPANEEQIPPDRADPQLLSAFWSSDWPWEKGLSPSPEARRKVLLATRKYPTSIDEVLNALPTDEAAMNEVAEILEKLPAKKDYEMNTRRKVRSWLFRHGGRMREQVLDDCLHPDWEAAINYKKPDASLDALLAREPAEAERILGKLADDADPRCRVLAAGLLGRRAEPAGKEAWRKCLLESAGDPKLPNDARSLAVWFLSKQEWPGKNEWVVSRLLSPDCGEADWFEPIIEPALEYWIPMLAKITAGDNRAARNRAAELLIRSAFEGKWAADALRPLLPWITDPSWADAQELRESLLEALCGVDLPECVDSLVTMLPKETNGDCIRYAALMLARYQVKHAVPPLKEALTRCNGYYELSDVVRSIRRLEEFSRDEIVGGLVAYFTSFPTDEVRDEFKRGFAKNYKPADVIGQSYADKLPDDAVLVEAILQRAREMRGTNPKLAAILRHCVMVGAPSHSAELVAEGLSRKSIQPDELAAALMHCRDKAWKVRAFDGLRKEKGSVAGLVAILTGDLQRAAALLADKNSEAWTAVLEAARLAREPLDFKRVAELMEMKDKEISGAAENYLMEREDPAAVELWERQLASDDPASLDSWNPKQGRFGRAGEIAEMLRQRFGFKDAPREIISLRSFSQGSGNDEWHVVIGDEQALAVHNFGGGRIGIGHLDANVVERIRKFLSTYQVDGLPSLEQPNFADGVSFGFTHATADGVHKIFIENPPTARPDLSPSATVGPLSYSRGIVIYGQLVDLITRSVESVDLKLHYESGAEILVPKETQEAVAVWNQGKDLRILTGENAGAKWLAVDPDSGAIRGPAEEPAACPVIKEVTDSAAVPKPPYSEERKSCARAGDAFLYFERLDDTQGIWMIRKGKPPELIAKGWFSGALATPDGKWCVAAKTEEGKAWDVPNGVVRIDLSTKQMIPVSLKAADNFDVITYLPARGKFLLRRARDYQSANGRPPVGPERAQYHLLDAASGALERIQGDFEGLGGKELRPLQKATKPGCVWMARYWNEGGSQHGTIVGIYDLRNFKFQAIRKVEGLNFDSMEMWVDEDAGFIQAVVNGDLIRTRLR